MGIASRGRAERSHACGSSACVPRMGLVDVCRLRARSLSVNEAVRAAPHRCSRSKERGRRWRIVDGYNDTRMDGPRRDGNGRRSLSQNTTSHLQHLHHPFFLDGWEDLPGPDPASCRIESGRAGALIRRRRRRPGSCFSHCPEIRVTFPSSRTASQAAARPLAPARSRPTRLTEHEIQFNDVRVASGAQLCQISPLPFWP